MEHQKYDLVLRNKRVKWIQLQSRLRSDTRIQLEEELKGAELQHRMCADEEVYLCELEQGSIISDSNNEDEDTKQTDGFMDPCKDGNQWKEMMFETTREAMDPYGFEINDYFMFAGEIGKERKFTDVVIKDKWRGHNLNYV